MVRSTDDIECLAERIAGPSRLQFGDLVEGIRLEQQRLGDRRYLLALWRQHLDYDGFDSHDSVYLCNSFCEIESAHDAEAQALEMLIREHARSSSPHLSWQVDHTRTSWDVEPVVTHPSLRVEEEDFLVLNGGPFDRIFFCARIIGRFEKVIVGADLLDFLDPSHFGLWSFFREVGEAHRMNRPPEAPWSRR